MWEGWPDGVDLRVGSHTWEYHRLLKLAKRRMENNTLDTKEVD